MNGEKYNVVSDGGIVGTKFGNYVITICINEKTDKDYFEDNKALDLAADLSSMFFVNYINDKYI